MTIFRDPLLLLLYYQILIGALAAAERVKEACAAFEAMVAEGLLPRIAHYHQLIVLHLRQKDLGSAEAWVQRLKTDKDLAPTRPALELLVETYTAVDAKKHDVKIKALQEQLNTMKAAETASLAPNEPSGVQWKMHWKPVTSTGGDDKGAAAKGGADKKPAAKPAAKK